MDRVATILKCQWRAYWRRFRRAGNLTTNNAGVLVLFGGLGLVRYFQQLPLTAAQLAKGETARYETLLAVVFVLWMLPVLGESRRSISSRDLLHFPLTSTELFSIRLASVFFSPVSWIVVFCSLALVYPITAASHPLAGMLAMLLLLLLGVFASLTIANLLNSGLVRRIAVVMLLASTVAVWFAWNRGGLKQSLSSLLPHRLAASAAVSSAPLRSVAILTFMVVLVLCLSRATFPLSLQPRQNRRSQKLTLFDAIEFPGRFGGLIKKDLRYGSRLLDLYLALPLVVLFDIYLISNPAPSAVGFWIVVGAVFLPCVGLVFNCFGLDSPLGLDRYALLPLSGRETLVSKNLAFAALMLALFALIVPLALWKFGVVVSGLGLLELNVIGLAYLTYGNWMSVKQPFKMQFYRFASGGSPADALMGLIFTSIPAVVSVYLLYHENARAVWKLALLAGLYFAIYFFSLARSARVFESEREAIRRSLS